MGRSSRHDRSVRAFKAKCEAKNAPCWICGGAIDYEAKSGPQRFNADHERPYSSLPPGHPDLWSHRNLRPSHQECNQRRGDVHRGQEDPSSLDWG